MCKINGRKTAISAEIRGNSGHQAILTGLGCIHEYLRQFRPKAMGDLSDTENETELMSMMQVDSKYSKNRFSCISESSRYGIQRLVRAVMAVMAGELQREYTNMGLATKSYKGYRLVRCNDIVVMNHDPPMNELSSLKLGCGAVNEQRLT